MPLVSSSTAADWRWVVRVFALGAMLVASAGCLGPAPPDGMPHPSYLNREMIRSPVVHLELVSVDDEPIPEEPLRRALARLETHIAGRFEVAGTGSLGLDESWDGILPRGRVHDASIAPSLTRVSLVFARRVAGDSRGVFMRMDDDWQQVLFSSSRIEETAGPFFPLEQVWEFVIFHELAHALGVPESPDHRWHAGHCTKPDCALYPRIDARALTTAILRLGPPMDLCHLCAGELRAVRSDPETGG
ncbi:MAG: hypothetical protein AAGE65_08540 [Planctomycetota bacterium]